MHKNYPARPWNIFLKNLTKTGQKPKFNVQPDETTDVTPQSYWQCVHMVLIPKGKEEEGEGIKYVWRPQISSVQLCVSRLKFFAC